MQRKSGSAVRHGCYSISCYMCCKGIPSYVEVHNPKSPLRVKAKILLISNFVKQNDHRLLAQFSVQGKK